MKRGWELALSLAVTAWAVMCVYCLGRPVPEPEPKPVSLPEIVEVKEAPEPVEEVPNYYDVPMDTETQDLLRAACEESGIDMELALAVIWKETDFRNIEGDGGNSLGYMQIQPRWHSERMERLGVTDLMDPASNFRVGCDFLSELLEDHALAYALTYYNSGKAVVSQYAEEVMGYMEEMR